MKALSAHHLEVGALERESSGVLVVADSVVASMAANFSLTLRA
jgi:hypothetical protein